MNNDWISELKPGDKVIVERGAFSTSALYLDIVERVTKTQVVTKKGRYKKRDGEGVPYVRYHSNRIKERCTEERAAKLRETAKRQQLVRQIKAEATAENLLGRTTEQLEQIYKWIVSE